MFFKGSRKNMKVLYLVARPLRSYPPPPLELSGQIFLGFFFRPSKKLFHLIGQALLLVAGPLKKIAFFAASLRGAQDPASKGSGSAALCWLSAFSSLNEFYKK